MIVNFLKIQLQLLNRRQLPPIFLCGQYSIIFLYKNPNIKRIINYRKERVIINIIYDIDKNNLRVLHFDSRMIYQLDELVFYIPTKYKNITPFLLIKDSQGEVDILKLKQTSMDKTYISFSTSLDNKIVVKNGQSELSVLFFNNDLFKSQTISLNLAYDNFSIAKQIYLIELLSKDIVKKHYQIEEMTKMNIDIYQQLEEGMRK